MRWIQLSCVGVLAMACGSPSPGGAGGAPGSGGTGGGGDPFGVGPTYCDLNPGAGGDACNGWIGVGLSPSPAHGSAGEPANVRPALDINYEFAPTTALKLAVEQGVTLTRADSGALVATENSWFVSREAHLAQYILAPESPLAAGDYYLTAPRLVWEEFGKAYSARRPNLTLFRAAEFPELPNGDLRSVFRVGN